jgi:hypothetical protein
MNRRQFKTLSEVSFAIITAISLFKSLPRFYILFPVLIKGPGNYKAELKPQLFRLWVRDQKNGPM